MRDVAKLRKGAHRELFQDVARGATGGQASDPTLHWLYKTMADTVPSAEYLHEKLGGVATRAAYPAGPFATKLKFIAANSSQGRHTRVLCFVIGIRYPCE